MSEDLEIELTQSNSMDWTLDEIMSSEIIYSGLIENYGQPAVDAVIKNLEIHKNDISLDNNTKIILRILNGDL